MSVSMGYKQGHSRPVTDHHAKRTADECARFVLPHISRIIDENLRQMPDNRHNTYSGRPCIKILDVGCGPGSITCDLASVIQAKGGQIVGVDSSAELIKQANDLAVSRGLRAENQDTQESRGNAAVSFQVGNIISEQGLPFQDQEFDIVYCHQVLVHMPQPVRALQEMRRVCRSSRAGRNGGIIAMREGDMQGLIIYPLTPELELYKEAYCAMLRSGGGCDSAGRQLHTWVRKACEADGAGTPVTTRAGSLTVMSNDANRESFADSFIHRLGDSESETRRNILSIPISLVNDDPSFQQRQRQRQQDGRQDNQRYAYSAHELNSMTQGFRAWKADSDGWMGVPQAEVIWHV